MNGLAAYILTVTAAAVLTAIVTSLAGKGTMGSLVKILGAVFMALTLISPILRLELPDLERVIDDFNYDGREAAAFGEDLAANEVHAIIKRQVEAYILDKAALYDAVLEVDVELDDSGMPFRVTLTGSVSPAVKAMLSRMMETELGLGEEVQHWIG